MTSRWPRPAAMEALMAAACSCARPSRKRMAGARGRPSAAIGASVSSAATLARNSGLHDAADPASHEALVENTPIA